VDARDVAQIAIQLFNSSIEGERFIVNAGTIPFKSFFDTVAEGLKRKSPSIKVNPMLAKLIATVESGRTRITGTEPLITSETARLANAFFEYDNQKVKKALNFNFQSIENTLQWCCEQYSRQHG
jgi:nucleoside-diphosphate-sugar epimerase